LGYLTPPPSPQPVIVYKDVGGLVSAYEAQTEAYRRENREVRLHECRSACTLALSLPNVCVYPDAQVKFHQAYNELTRETDLGVSTRLFDSYPAAVRGRLGYLTRQYKILSGVELIALGVRNCLGDDKIMIAKRRPAAPQPPTVVADPLREMAQNVSVAVAKALNRSEGAAPEPIAVADRNPAPISPAAYESPTAILEAPLPPRRPNFEDVVVAGPGLTPPALINGAHPILDAARFVPPEYQAASRGDLAKAGG